MSCKFTNLRSLHQRTACLAYSLGTQTLSKYSCKCQFHQSSKIINVFSGEISKENHDSDEETIIITTEWTD